MLLSFLNPLFLVTSSIYWCICLSLLKIRLTFKMVYLLIFGQEKKMYCNEGHRENSQFEKLVLDSPLDCRLSIHPETDQ